MQNKIPASAWIVIGVGMMIMSILINYEKLSFFILVGAIFIVVGFLKILLKEKKETHAHITRQNPAQHPIQHGHHTPQQRPAHQTHNPQSVQHAQHIVHPPEIKCSGCGVKLHPRFQYCPNCGYKLR